MYLFREDLKEKKPVNINVFKKKIKLGLNESPLDPMQILQEQFLEKMKNVHINRYFNEITTKLVTKLSDYAEVEKEALTFGNGADEMLFYTFSAVRNDNKSFAVSLAPSYFDYKSYSGAVGLGIKFMSLQPDFDFSVSEYLQMARAEDCKLVIVCNPNNPTGNLFADDKVLEIIESSSQLVLVDETYFEFSGKTFADLIYEHRNLIIVRSFSKSFSAAGLRFGYLITHPDNINELKKVMTIFHLNLMSQAFVSTLLDNKEIFLDQVRKINQNKQNVFEELEKINGIKVHPSETNFLTFTAGKKTKALFDHITKNDIAIRPVWHHPVLHDHVRVTISNDEDNSAFLASLKNFEGLR